MSESSIPVSPPEAGSLYCEATGTLPAWQTFPSAVRRLYDHYMSPLPSVTKVREFRPTLVHGQYKSRFDRKILKDFFATLSKTDAEGNPWPTLPGSEKAAMSTDGLQFHTVDIPGTDVTLEITLPAPVNTLQASDPLSDPVPGGPIFLYHHGGGLMFGRAAKAEVANRVASEFGIPCVSVGYRLAPEHRFPTAHDDADLALRYVLGPEFSGTLGYNVTGVVLGGTSSGANLALSAGIRLASECKAAGSSGMMTLSDGDGTGEDVRSRLLGIVVTQPVCGVTPAGKHVQSEGDGVANSQMDAAMMRFFDRHYARTKNDLKDPRWAINRLSRDTLSTSPPLALFPAELDYLRAGAESFANQVEEAGGSGGQVQMGLFRNLPHTAQNLDGICMEAREGNVEVLKAVGRMLGHSEETLAEITVETVFAGMPLLDI